MMKSFFVLLALALPTLTFASEALPQSSLFFTPAQTREAEALAAKAAPAGTADIRLGAVMFYATDDWALWLQGEKWTPQTVRDNLQVLNVTASEVRLIWRGDGEQKKITLRPNETYQIATDTIMAGQ